MGKRLKRGKQGNAAMYLTRNQAIKKLQLPLSQFRRLCILKGLHPREPKKKPQGANKTYYHVKDINWLLHEPILQVLRDVKAHGKKVRKARAKKNERLARRLMRLKPGYRLDHLVKERYPTFVDALRDLDDALTLVHLFAALPADSRRNVPRATVETARRLAVEWGAFVARSGSLRRVFVSVKGYYYQAEVMGQQVTWLQPHALQQVLPDDVDCRVLLTFHEFYATLVQFVLFRLYTGELKMSYPPKLLLAGAGSSGGASAGDGGRGMAWGMGGDGQRAAEGVAALMRGIADAQAQARAQRAAAEAAGEGGDKAAKGKASEAPDVVERIGTLAARIRQIEAEEEKDGGGRQGSEEEEDAIDSGDGDDEEASEEEAKDEEEDDEEPPMAIDIAATKATTTTLITNPDDASAAGGALCVDPDDDAAVCASLLRGCVVFLSREVPREPLLLVVKAFGGEACWDGEGSPRPADDSAITHAIVDRPAPATATTAGKGNSDNSSSGNGSNGSGSKAMMAAWRQRGVKLVQPQWAFDSANFRVVMPESLYAPGAPPPPHLSPFVDPEEEGYTPEFYATVRKLQEAARRARLRAAGRQAAGDFLGGDGEDVDAVAAAEVADALEDDAAAAQAYARDLEREVRKAAARAEGDEEDEEDEDEEEEDDEEAAAKTTTKKKGGVNDDDEEETAKMKDIMMNTKTRKLYARIQRAVQGKRERAEALERRREELSKKQQQQQQQQQPAEKKKKAVAVAAPVAESGRPKRARK